MTVPETVTITASAEQLRAAAAHLRGDDIDLDALADKQYPAPVPINDFQPASDLEALMWRIIAKHDHRIGWLAKWRIRVFWKRKGGAKGGRPVFGKTTKPSGLTKTLLDNADGLIWLAADSVRMWGMTYRQVEALLFHELCHFDLKETDDGDELVMKGHDAEIFLAELEEYGTWFDDLEHLASTVRQLPLPLEAQ